MTYKNNKTGQVIITTGKVVGDDWTLVKEKAQEPTPKIAVEPKGKTVTESKGKKK